MGTSETESYEGCLWTKFKHLPPQLALKLSLVRLVLRKPDVRFEPMNLLLCSTIEMIFNI